MLFINDDCKQIVVEYTAIHRALAIACCTQLVVHNLVTMNEYKFASLISVRYY